MLSWYMVDRAAPSFPTRVHGFLALIGILTCHPLRLMLLGPGSSALSINVVTASQDLTRHSRNWILKFLYVLDVDG